MFSGVAKKIFGTANERKLKAYRSELEAINALESELEALSDEALKARTQTFREQLKDGKKLDDLIIPAFATVREASKRVLGQRPFDVQIMSALALHKGKITEMKTGEGKTLSSTLPSYLNALTGEGVHIVTVNDYLAKRDAEWMGGLYQFLGLEVGCVLGGMDDKERRQAYQADITYGTNNEFGFDYLRDNMKYQLEDMVQRGHSFAIVDEVDSILIDEARTPLIISGALEDRSDLYIKIDKIIPKLKPKHYEIDEKTRNVTLTDEGNEHTEKLLKEAGILEEGTIYDIGNVNLVHHINQALRAHKLFSRDKDYIVKDDAVMIIDEFTGRMMTGRRYSDGLHQALEAKEGADIQAENQTLASITFQNYFRLYTKLSGMTGTAMTEAHEFLDIYKLESIEIPTNMEVKREDCDDEIYRTAQEKYDAIIARVIEAVNQKQPVLVGTTSIEKSELLSKMLKKNKIAHNVLNARYHEQEAHIIAQAGMPKSVTIATNMAGRGTDIQLGGNLDMQLDALPESKDKEKKKKEIADNIKKNKEIVIKAGGLCVIGTERHESRRIDNQLRGRSGRQGDPGLSLFFLSLEDDLMRIFGTGSMDKMLQRLGLKKGEAITHPWISRALEKAQQKVEERNFDIRKNVLKYDDVMNDQRKVIFEQRIELMETDNVSETTDEMREQAIESTISDYIPEKSYPEQWDSKGLQEHLRNDFYMDIPIKDWANEEGIGQEEIVKRLSETCNKVLAAKAAHIGDALMQRVQKSVLLQTIDQNWREHLLTLEHLREVIGLRGYGQRDPLNEYKTEAFSLFENLLWKLRFEVTKLLMSIRIEEHEDAPPKTLSRKDMHTNKQEIEGNLQGGIGAPEMKKQQAAKTPFRSTKTPRNATCPCGSGKKYKHCCGKL